MRRRNLVTYSNIFQSHFNVKKFCVYFDMTNTLKSTTAETLCQIIRQNICADASTTVIVWKEQSSRTNQQKNNLF